MFQTKLFLGHVLTLCYVMSFETLTKSVWTQTYRMYVPNIDSLDKFQRTSTLSNVTEIQWAVSEVKHRGRKDLSIIRSLHLKCNSVARLNSLLCTRTFIFNGFWLRLNNPAVKTIQRANEFFATVQWVLCQAMQNWTLRQILFKPLSPG